uniref:PH domain-containing protein n=1 Tax=Rothia endophytica TaxID=1324766 RepID=A0ABP9B1D6_9MICC
MSATKPENTAHSDEPSDWKQEQTLTWRRAHPLSPLVRSWLIIVAFLFGIVRPAVEDFFRGDDPLTFQDLATAQPPESGILAWLHIFGSFWLPVAAVLVFLLLLVPFFLTWFFYRFAVDTSNVYIKSGMLFKTERKARLDRVQSIDVNRPLVARILGLAELKFDVADGAGSALQVQYLSYREARRLRDELLVQVRDLKSGSKPSAAGSQLEPGHPDSAPGVQAGEHHLRQRLAQHVTENFLGARGKGEQQIVHVPVARLLGSMFLSLGVVSGVLFVGALMGVMLWSDISFGAVFASNLALIAGLASALWKRLNTGWNFRLVTSPDGLKTRFGLTDTVTRTVPEGRIQSVIVTQPLLWRLTGWYKVSVALAGQGEGENAAFAGELLPVGTRADLLRILPLVVVDEAHGGATAEQLHAGLDAKGSGHGFTASQLTARFRVDWFAISRNAFSQTPALLLVRGGMMTKKLSITPHAKIQQLELKQGPLGKRYDYAEVSVTAAGALVSGSEIDLVDTATARALLVRQAQLGVHANQVLAAPGVYSQTEQRTALD